MQSWRKAYGSIKDTTSVSLANLNSDFKVRIQSSRVFPRFLRIFIYLSLVKSIQTLVFSSTKRVGIACGALDLRGFDWNLLGCVLL